MILAGLFGQQVKVNGMIQAALGVGLCDLWDQFQLYSVMILCSPDCVVDLAHNASPTHEFQRSKIALPHEHLYADRKLFINFSPSTSTY